MLEKPAISDEWIISLIRQAYGIETARVEFLPLGADVNTAVYRVETVETPPNFLKIRKGNFEITSLTIPQFLYEQGVRQVIPPRKTVEGKLWASVDGYNCILYPYISGRDAYDLPLTDDQWVTFGAALRQVHSVVLPPDLREALTSETYSPRWRELVRAFQKQVQVNEYRDPVSARLADFMRAHREEIALVVERAEQLAAAVLAHPVENVLCHSDIHAWNLLIGEDGSLYIVDWDNPILAPKERDLMFIGAGLGRIWNTEREERLFYQGYGAGEVDLTALTYYRYERIVQDFAAFCEQILLSTEGGEDREQGLRFFTGQFQPGEVIEMAHKTYQKG